MYLAEMIIKMFKNAFLMFGLSSTIPSKKTSNVHYISNVLIGHYEPTINWSCKSWFPKINIIV